MNQKPQSIPVPLGSAGYAKICGLHDASHSKHSESGNPRRKIWHAGATRVENIPQNAKRALHDHLMAAGELLRSEALEPSLPQQGTKRPEIELFEDIP